MNARNKFQLFVKYRKLVGDISLVASLLLLSFSVLVTGKVTLSDWQVDVCRTPDGLDESATKSLLSVVEPAVREQMAKPDTVVFSAPTIDATTLVVKVSGHFTSHSRNSSDVVDNVYSAGLMRTSDTEWKLVHLAVNGDVSIHTLP